MLSAYTVTPSQQLTGIKDVRQRAAFATTQSPPFDSGVNAFADPAGVGLGNKSSVQHRFDEIHHGMVHHAIAKRRRCDHPGFAIVDRE